MEISYYPGCSLKTSAINFERTALSTLEELGIYALELPRWNCCGVMFSQSADNLMLQLAPARVIMEARETGRKRLLTLCSMCYNTLKRSLLFFKRNGEKLKKINAFLKLEERDFSAEGVEVIHLLTLLSELDTSNFKMKIKKIKSNLKVASYYGCLLTRPREIALDGVENPQIMEKLLEIAGFQTVNYPFKTDCCASFQVVNRRNVVKKQIRKIVTSAVRNGAEIFALSCPLCEYNLDSVQQELAQEDETFTPIPVLYISQLLSLALGQDPKLNDFSLHRIDPRPLFKEKGLL
ncbi:MAG: heterodisulfide reductase, subunit B [Spirochaetes bacterium]|nr:MAG: heterodisulfide reductase, subunit B [Spirochaetota bacterium]